MKVAFLISNLEDPSARYRVKQYISFLEKEGYIPEVFAIPKNYWNRLELFRKTRNFKIVFLHRKLFNFIDWRILRKYSQKLIYDFDDAVMFRDSDNENVYSYQRKSNFERTVKNADIVIAGNEYLRDFSLMKNKKTVVIPTSIDMERYTKKTSFPAFNSITIGWIGSSSTLFYIKKLRNILNTIYDRFPNVKFKIVADDFFDCNRMPVMKKQWKYEEEIDDLHTFDIGLMPLTADPWSRGKCGFKLLQYMAIGIPAVCSPVGANKTIVTDGINGFWAEGEDEWIEKLTILINDSQLRFRMGKKAREMVINNYSLEVISRKVVEVFNTLMN